MEFDFTRFFQAGKRSNRRLNFHAVVRRCDLSADELFCHTTVFKDGSPTAGTGVSEARSVSVNRYFFHAQSDGGKIARAFTNKSRSSSKPATVMRNSGSRISTTIRFSSFVMTFNPSGGGSSFIGM